MSFGTRGCMYNCGDVCTKECLPERKVEKYFEMMNFLVINHKQYNDQQWAERFQLACAEIPFGTEVTHAGSNKIITERVLAYCKAKKIHHDDYDGPLPYRSFTIPVGNKK